MATVVFTKFVPTVLGAAAIGFGALMTVGAASAHASEKSDCEGKGGSYTETQVNWNGKDSTVYRCCVKDTATNTTSCTSTTVTKNSRIPLTVRPEVIETVQTDEPVAPPQRVPLGVMNADPQLQLTP
jgi:hypothetical protein